MTNLTNPVNQAISYIIILEHYEKFCNGYGWVELIGINSIGSPRFRVPKSKNKKHKNYYLSNRKSIIITSSNFKDSKTNIKSKDNKINLRGTYIKDNERLLLLNDISTKKYRCIGYGK